MLIFLSLLAGIYSLDIITKMAVRARLPLGSEVSVLPVFSLVHVENSGIAFGLFPDRNWFFVVAGILLTAAIIWMAMTAWRQDRPTSYALAVVLGGAWGNLTDRILYGRVTDFLDFFISTHHWPAFNVADSAICVGAGFILLRNLTQRTPHVPHAH